LIPLYGAIGAAASTLLAYAILALMAFTVNQRLYPIPFETGLFITLLVIGLGLYLGSIFLGQGLGTYGAWGISFSALALYSGCLLLFANLSVQRNKNTSRQAKETFLS
jgi:hypothetical protein